jgi:hypothetical protein
MFLSIIFQAPAGRRALGERLQHREQQIHFYRRKQDIEGSEGWKFNHPAFATRSEAGECQQRSGNATAGTAKTRMNANGFRGLPALSLPAVSLSNRPKGKNHFW